MVGSPFRCRVYDLTKVQIIRDESQEGVDRDGIPGEDIVFFGKSLLSSNYVETDQQMVVLVNRSC